jgi:hypothetical protein
MQAGIPEQIIPYQLHLRMFAPHELIVWEEEQHRRILRKLLRDEHRSPWVPWRQREDHATRSLFDEIDLSLLEQPLGGPQEGNELNCDSDDFHEWWVSADTCTEIGVDIRAEPDEGREPWSDQAVEQLHEAILHYSLKALKARGNGAEKREVLQWIFAPKPMVAVLSDEHGNPVEALLSRSETPFSFERCCRTCGYSPERLMDGLMPVLREMGLGNVFNEITNGTNPNPNTNDTHEAGAERQPLQSP